MPPLFTDHYASVNGLKLHYTQFLLNNHDQQTIVCIHGSYQTSHTWDDFIDCAQTMGLNATIICIDLRGHGDSEHSPSASYALDDFTLDISLFLQQMIPDANKRVVLIGMSLGGLCVLRSLTTASSASLPQVQAAIVVDISYKGLQQGKSVIARNMEKTDTLLSFDDYLKWAQQSNPSRSIENLKSRLAFSLKKLSSTGGWVWKYDHNYNVQTFVCTVSEGEWESKLSLLKIPVLLVRGGSSNVTTQEQMEQLQHTIGAKTCQLVEINGAGHSVQGDKPEEFAKHVVQFVSNT